MRALILLAHADDETLGAGGLIQKLLARGHEVQLRIVSEGVVALRGQPSDNRQALAEACKLLGVSDWQSLGFADQQFERAGVAEIARAAAASIEPPDLIVSHSASDLNQDHRITAEAARILGRPRGRQVSLLACEIPCVAAWNGNAFRPGFYVDIAPFLETKIAAFSLYTDENRAFPDPYSPEGLRTLARFRGMESGLEAAEAFEVLRCYDHFTL
jgi:LmbE family N-acetylglucosaminyl deacetylase